MDRILRKVSGRLRLNGTTLTGGGSVSSRPLGSGMAVRRFSTAPIRRAGISNLVQEGPRESQTAHGMSMSKPMTP